MVSTFPTRQQFEQMSWDDYWAETRFIIEELKGGGHDLWSHGYDGEARPLWGPD